MENNLDKDPADLDAVSEESQEEDNRSYVAFMKTKLMQPFYFYRKGIVLHKSKLGSKHQNKR